MYHFTFLLMPGTCSLGLVYQTRNGNRQKRQSYTNEAQMLLTTLVTT